MRRLRKGVSRHPAEIAASIESGFVITLRGELTDLFFFRDAANELRFFLSFC